VEDIPLWTGTKLALPRIGGRAIGSRCPPSLASTIGPDDVNSDDLARQR
jgi:hypothetical protein